MADLKIMLLPIGYWESKCSALIQRCDFNIRLDEMNIFILISDFMYLIDMKQNYAYTHEIQRIHNQPKLKEIKQSIRETPKHENLQK